MNKINKPSIINPFDITNYERSLSEKQMFIIFAMAVAGKEARQISFKVMDLIYNPILKDADNSLSLYENIKIAMDKGEDPYLYLYNNTIDFENNAILDKDGMLLSPFEILKIFVDSNTLEEELKRVKLGKYALLNKGYSMLANGALDLSGSNPHSAHEYEKIPGISFKSSRFFILHSYKDSEIAVLDTHILKFLKEAGVKECENISSTPGSLKLYLEIEKRFLEILNGIRSGNLKKREESKILNMLGKYLPADRKNLSASDFDFAIWKYSKEAREA